MGITSGQIIVGLTPVVVDGVSTNPYRLVIHNHSNTKALFLGNSNVTPTNGLPLHGEQYLEVIVSPNQQMYIVSDSGEHEVAWLRMDV
jgi:hypothetical protein